MLALAGGKGGSGKTTTTLGLARAAAGPVVAVDADRDMPNLHAMAGVDRGPGARPAARPDAGDARVSVHPAPRTADDDAFESWLRAVGDAEAPTVVDCPAGAGPDAAVPLRVADAVVVVAPLCAPALRDAAKTAAMARAIGTPVAGVVVSRARLAPDAVSDLVEAPVLGAVPEGSSPVLADPSVAAAHRRIAGRLRGEGLL